MKHIKSRKLSFLTMRIAICTVLTLLLALSLLGCESQAPAASQGLEFTSNGDGTCYLSGIGTCEDVHVVVPTHSPAGDKVVAVGTYAYEKDPCTGTLYGDSVFKDWECLLSIVIPDTVTEIGDFAFEYCKKLRRVEIGDGVTTIGNAAFSNCSALKEITFGSSVQSIGNSAFETCHALRSLEFPNSLSSIGEAAFFYCISLNSVTVESDALEVGRNAFRHCYRLAEIINRGALPLQIGSEDYGCMAAYAVEIHDGKKSNLQEEGDCLVYSSGTKNVLVQYYGTGTELTLPEACDGKPYEIGCGLFFQNEELTSVIIPEGVTKIGESAFDKCEALRLVTLPSSLVEIGDRAFRSTELTEITLPQGLQSIGEGAFSLTKLTRVKIPEGVTEIGEGAFGQCRSLAEVTLPQSLQVLGEGAFAYNDSLVSIRLPQGLTVIAEDTFSWCDVLTEVYIPASVASIGVEAFFECPALTRVHFADPSGWKAVTVVYDENGKEIELTNGNPNSILPNEETLSNAESAAQCVRDLATWKLVKK